MDRRFDRITLIKNDSEKSEIMTLDEILTQYMRQKKKKNKTKKVKNYMKKKRKILRKKFESLSNVERLLITGFISIIITLIIFYLFIPHQPRYIPKEPKTSLEPVFID